MSGQRLHLAPEELLLDYAAGALPEGPALAVALHAALDPEASRTIALLGAAAGALLESALADAEPAPPTPTPALALERTLAKLEAVAIEPAAAPYVARPGFEWAPPALAPYLGPGTRWHAAYGGLGRIPIRLGEDSHRVEILRLMPGRGLPLHRHAGSEYTVVLQGGYADETGRYGVGDFAVGPGERDHRPIADPGEPCIALIVLEQPIVLSGPFGRWLNPLVRRGWI